MEIAAVTWGRGRRNLPIKAADNHQQPILLHMGSPKAKR